MAGLLERFFIRSSLRALQSTTRLRDASSPPLRDHFPLCKYRMSNLLQVRKLPSEHLANDDCAKACNGEDHLNAGDTSNNAAEIGLRSA